MNYDLAREVIGCLRVSGSPRAHAERLSGFGLPEWKQNLRWLDEAGLALLLWRRLEELGIASVLPAEIRAALQRNLRDHQRRITEMAREFDTLNGAFDSAGVRYVALKGFALIPEYCPCASLRTTYDYDYLVHGSELERACRTLEAVHYRVQAGSAGQPLEFFREDARPRNPLSRDDLYSEAFPRSIDLHCQFWNPDELKIRLDFQGDFLARRQLRALTAEQLGMEESGPCSSLRFWALCDEDELLFQLLHVFRHVVQDWCRLASLHDIAWFVARRSSDATFWERFLERVRSCRPLREIAGVALSLSARLFGASLPEAVVAETVRGMRSAVGLWVNRYGFESAVDNFSGDKLGLLLHREFIGDGSAWQSIERRRLFPLHRPNRVAVASTPTPRARVAASWKQSVYVARRLHHHMLAAAQYRLERLRWDRMLAKGSREAAFPPA